MSRTCSFHDGANCFQCFMFYYASICYGGYSYTLTKGDKYLYKLHETFYHLFKKPSLFEARRQTRGRGVIYESHYTFIQTENTVNNVGGAGGTYIY